MLTFPLIDKPSAPVSPATDVVDETFVDASLAAQDAASDVKTNWIYMFAQLYTSGTSIEECAELLQKSVPVLEAMTSTPRFQGIIMKVAKEKPHQLEKFLRSQAMPMMIVLSTIAIDPKNTASQRIAAANAVLDRAFGGKPALGKPIDTSSKTPISDFSDPAKAKAYLDREIDRRLKQNPLPPSCPQP